MWSLHLKYSASKFTCGLTNLYSTNNFIHSSPTCGLTEHRQASSEWFIANDQWLWLARWCRSKRGTLQAPSLMETNRSNMEPGILRENWVENHQIQYMREKRGPIAGVDEKQLSSQVQQTLAGSQTLNSHCHSSETSVFTGEISFWIKVLISWWPFKASLWRKWRNLLLHL